MKLAHPVRTEAESIVQDLLGLSHEADWIHPPDVDREENQFPKYMRDIDGVIWNTIDLAKNKHLFCIVFKNTTCPVCPRFCWEASLMGFGAEPFLQDDGTYDLTRGFQLPMSNLTHDLPHPITAEMRNKWAVLMDLDVQWIVFCPGSSAALSKLRDKMPDDWKRTPWFADDDCLDTGISLISFLSIGIPEGAVPMTIMINPRAIATTVQEGRHPGDTGIMRCFKTLHQLRRSSELYANGTLLLISKYHKLFAVLDAHTHHFLRQPRVPVEILEKIFSFLNDDIVVDLASSRDEFIRAVSIHELKLRTIESFNDIDRCLPPPPDDSYVNSVEQPLTRVCNLGSSYNAGLMIPDLSWTTASGTGSMLLPRYSDQKLYMTASKHRQRLKLYYQHLESLIA